MDLLRMAMTLAQGPTGAGAAGAPGAAPAGADAPATAAMSVFDFVVKGGPVMIPIGVCSLVALAIVAERAIKLGRSSIIPRGFVEGLKGVLRDPVRDRAAAIEYCGKSNTPVARVFAAAVRRLGEPVDLLERHIQEAGEREVPLLRKRLRMLSVIASVSTLLGLLGTITGMINAFQVVAAHAEALGRTELLARGIYEAMITTAGGLIVAIPTIIVYHWLAAKVEQLVHAIDQLTVDFIEEYALARPAAAVEPKPSPQPATASLASTPTTSTPQLNGELAIPAPAA